MNPADCGGKPRWQRDTRLLVSPRRRRLEHTWPQTSSNMRVTNPPLSTRLPDVAHGTAILAPAIRYGTNLELSGSSVGFGRFGDTVQNLRSWQRMTPMTLPSTLVPASTGTLLGSAGGRREVLQPIKSLELPISGEAGRVSSRVAEPRYGIGVNSQVATNAHEFTTPKFFGADRGEPVPRESVGAVPAVWPVFGRNRRLRR